MFHSLSGGLFRLATLLASVGAAVIRIWRVGHLVPTRSVVSGFGELTADNARIITMEWVAEGLTLCFIGVLAAPVTLLHLGRYPGLE